MSKWIGSILLFVAVGSFLGGVCFVQTLVKNADIPDPCADGSCVPLEGKLTVDSPDYLFQIGGQTKYVTIVVPNPEGTQLSVNCPKEATVVASNGGTSFQIGTASEVVLSCKATVTRWSMFLTKIILQVTAYK